MSDTVTLRVGTQWVELQGIEHGFLLNRVSGALLYYLYSDDWPTKEDKGILYVNTTNPQPLAGGRVFLRSQDVTVASYTPMIANPTLVLEQIGDMGQLPYDNLVDAVIDLNNKIDATGGGVTSLIMNHEIEITSSMIADKQLTLPFEAEESTFALTIFGGPLQRRFVDFNIAGDIVSWDTLSLELLLLAGDVICVSYVRR